MHAHTFPGVYNQNGERNLYSLFSRKTIQKCLIILPTLLIKEKFKNGGITLK
jgi:hypothetical protein